MFTPNKKPTNALSYHDANSVLRRHEDEQRARATAFGDQEAIECDLTDETSPSNRLNTMLMELQMEGDPSLLQTPMQTRLQFTYPITQRFREEKSGGVERAGLKAPRKLF